ncbi:hypothetical protein [Acinetobacter baumannii]|uniref:hypothetical protein n=1 Tax=Acinetobacter baumannii TaxID=470 RepID=UPI00385BAC59
MTDLNKEREVDTLPEVAHLLEQCKHRDLTLIERAFVKGARYAWQEKAKAQAVPNEIINKIQSWVAVKSFAVEDAHPDLPIIDANELAEFIDQLVASESGPEG